MTVVLELGVPHIIVEIDGIQIHARLSENDKTPSKSREAEPTEPRAASPARHRRPVSPPVPNDSSDASSDFDDDHIPTVDDLADSFIREEPEEEIRELEQELQYQSTNLQDSVTSSDDGDDESVSGMGTPLGLPAYLRTILNTALDRLQIIVNDIDFEVQDHLSCDGSADAREEESYTSLNFHVDRIAIDSVTAEEPRVDVSTTMQDASSKLGKRRLRIENICGQLISDTSNFTSFLRASIPSSPVDARSEISSGQKAQSDLSTSQASVKSEPSQNLQDSLIAMSTTRDGDQPAVENKPELEPGVESTVGLQPDHPATPESPIAHQSQLVSSIHTTDDDRFADAASDDGLERSVASVTRSESPQHEIDASSILYEEGLLDYAMHNDLLNLGLVESEHSDAQGLSQSSSNLWGVDGAGSTHEEALSHYGNDSSMSNLPTVSMLGQPEIMAQISESPSHSKVLNELSTSTQSLSNDKQTPEERIEPPKETPLLPATSQVLPGADLSESMLFSHSDAESMYMSALSATASRSGHVPGGWESSSSASSHDALSEHSGSVPDEMIAGSILHPSQDADDGCETPRPSSPHSAVSSSQRTRRTSATGLKDSSKIQHMLQQLSAKTFLTVDLITVWFPLGLQEDQATDPTIESVLQTSEFNFSPPGLPEDSFFQGMPGSFSSYAQSAATRRKNSAEEVSRRRPSARAPSKEKYTTAPKKNYPVAVSVEIGSVIGQLDFSTGRIMVQMFERAMAAIVGQSGQDIRPQPKAQAISTPVKSNYSVEVSAKHICVSWRERLLAESLLDGNAPRTPLETNPSDAILKIRMSSIYAASQTRALESQTKLQIGTLAFSSLDHDIITFQTSRSRSRRSVNHATEQLKNDIEVLYEQKQDCRITVVTRPVKVLFDLQKLDDALVSFGGFSGVLELSASMTSNSQSNSPIASPTPPRPRGVHFGDTPAPASASPSKTPKIQVQFGDVSFVLRGKSCAVQLQTTSIRIALRESNVRLKVADIQFTGPYVDGTHEGAPLIVEIKDSTINFLFVPEEVDMDKLISMITPSKDPYENNEDILIGTLLRQRKKGSVLRADVKSVDVRVSDVEQLKGFEVLGAEMAKLSKVTKYLPDDDRPGILTLAHVEEIAISARVNERLGDMSARLEDASIAHVGVPALFAAEVGKVFVRREGEVLVHEVVRLAESDQLPMLMMRIIGDEIEPIMKAKLFNVCAEYRVSTIMAALGLSEDGTVDDIALGLASSVVTVTGVSPPKTLTRQSSAATSSPTATKPLHLDILFRNCALGLNPRRMSAKGLFVLTDAHFLGKQTKNIGYSVNLELRKASVQIIDDVARLEEQQSTASSSPRTLTTNAHLRELTALGYVSVSSIAAARILVTIIGDGASESQKVDVEFKNDLFVIESCADSTQTLIAILGGLQPPTPPSTAERYRTVVPLQEMMNSFTADAGVAPTATEGDDFMETADLIADEVPTNLEFVGSFYNQDSLPSDEEMGDSMLGEDDLGSLASPPVTRKFGAKALESFEEQYEVADDETSGEKELDFREEYFQDSDSDNKGKARKWDSAKNRYHLSNEFQSPTAPLKVRVRDMNIIWNLYDGYDWPKTRGVLAQAVENIEARAEERRRKAQDDEDEDINFIEEDYLFNSVWIGVPVQEAKGTLTKQVFQDINRGRDSDDLVSETGSYATSTVTRTTGATARPRDSISSKHRLKLGRGKHKRIAFELKNVAVDLVVFEPGSGETVNSVDVRIQDLIAYDRVPGSTWNKLALCNVEPEKREMERPMIHLALLTVKPVTELAASELVIKLSVLPLRLHADQFAVEFIQRFFMFKDESASTLSESGPSEQAFIQRLEINTIKLKLDYKPRKVDYRSLRYGRTTEFMNFLTLQDTDIELRHAILYGLTSLDELHTTLNNVWTSDVKRNQLPKVLSGVAVLRPVANVGLGVADLFVVPMREYRKDGRVVRSLQKGAATFARNTTSEVARLGAKVAIGAQTILEGAEKFLNPEAGSPGRASAHQDWDGEDPSSDSEEPRAVSNYADQPITVRAGLRSAARHLQKDLHTARDAIIAIPSEIMEEGTGVGLAKVLARRAPTVVLKPVQGATKFVSKTLLGVGNALDPQSRRKIDDVSHNRVPLVLNFVLMIS